MLRVLVKWAREEKFWRGQSSRRFASAVRQRNRRALLGTIREGNRLGVGDDSPARVGSEADQAVMGNKDPDRPVLAGDAPGIDDLL